MVALLSRRNRPDVVWEVGGWEVMERVQCIAGHSQTVSEAHILG